MQHFYLTDFIKSKTVDEELAAALAAQCKTITCKKGEILQRPGYARGDAFFVQRGLLRYYGIDKKGREHILQFAPEGWFIGDRQAHCPQPQDFFIDALEDTEAMVLDYDFINSLAQRQPAFLEINNKLLNNHIRALQQRVYSLIGESAEERYLHFVQLYPDILLRVPQTMVASYLGITPESLSRIRKELAVRNKQPH